MHRWIAYATVLVAAGVYISLAIRGNPRDIDNRFREAEILCLEQNWDAARDQLKQLLRLAPSHAGAHFYLGRAYMFGTDFRPVMAEGEFLTALALFERQSKKSPIDRFPPKYFEMMCYIEAAKANLAQITVYVKRGTPLEALQSLVDDSVYYAEKANRIMPQAQEVETLFELLRPFRIQGSSDDSDREAPPVSVSPEYTV